MRKSTLIGAAGAMLAMVATASPANAVPGNICPYPPNNPTLSLNLQLPQIVAGQRIAIGGNLRRNNCGLPQGKVGIFIRTRPGPYHWIATSVTNANGGWGIRIEPRSSWDIRAIFSGEPNYGRAESVTKHLTVTPAP